MQNPRRRNRYACQSKLIQQYNIPNSVQRAECDATAQDISDATTLFQQETFRLSATVARVTQEKAQLQDDVDRKDKLITSLDTDLQRKTGEAKSWKEECERKDEEMKEALARSTTLETVCYGLREEVKDKREECASKEVSIGRVESAS